jgi:hypothetical protein
MCLLVQSEVLKDIVGNRNMKSIIYMKKLNVRLFGSRGVGKATIVIQCERGKFQDCYCSTSEDQFKKVMKIGNQKVKTKSDEKTTKRTQMEIKRNQKSNSR